MKIIDIKSLEIPDVKVLRIARFPDHRGYFTEAFRQSDFDNIPFFRGIRFMQSNESYSKPNTIRGLHFQWGTPPMGKLVRTLYGRMTDMVMDIRLKSPTFGKIIAYDMPSKPEFDYYDWIWVPPGFAHGNFFTENTFIEYFCSASYNPQCEAGISPLSEDIDWSLCDKKLKQLFESIKASNPLMTPKDISSFSVKSWTEDDRSKNFTL